MQKNLIIFFYVFLEDFLRTKYTLKRLRIIRSFRRRFNNYVYSHYTKNFIEFDGRKMYLDKDDSLHLSIRDYAPFHKQFVKKIIQKDDVVIDIGAHIGYYTLLFSELVGKKGKVFSFEPVIESFELLEKNIKENNFTNVTAIQKAVSNETKLTKLFLTPNATTHKISNNDPSSECIDVHSITLDEYFKEFDGDVNFIKCVSQGADFAVIQGMKKLLKKMDNLKIMIAFSPPRLTEFGSDPSEFLKTLVDSNFFIYEVNWNKEIFLTTSEQLLKKYALEKNNATYIFCTKEKLIDI
jgi:FkbM family methyltransferase